MVTMAWSPRQGLAASSRRGEPDPARPAPGTATAARVGHARPYDRLIGAGL